MMMLLVAIEIETDLDTLPPGRKKGLALLRLTLIDIGD
jgi:hypothetical protein